jgi:hypothetical protein
MIKNTGYVYDGEQLDGNTAKVWYVSTDKLWRVVVSRELDAPASGPTSLELTPDYDSEGNTGGYDSAGIQLGDLRGLPLVDARKRLEAVWQTHRAKALLAELPESFEGELAYAILARVFVMLKGWGIRNPVATIRREHGAGLTANAWNMRVARAKENGFLSGDKDNPALTGKALALLEGLS